MKRPLGFSPTFLALAVIAALFLAPLLWMVAVSFKPAGEVFSPSFLPQEPSLDAYNAIIRAEQFDYLLYARNTLIILLLGLGGAPLQAGIDFAEHSATSSRRSSARHEHTRPVSWPAGSEISATLQRGRPQAAGTGRARIAAPEPREWRRCR